MCKYNRFEISSEERDQLKKLYDRGIKTWDEQDLYEKIAWEIKSELKSKHEEKGGAFENFEDFENYYYNILDNPADYFNDLVTLPQMNKVYLRFWYYEIFEKYLELRELEEIEEILNIFYIVTAVFCCIALELNRALLYQQITGKNAETEEQAEKGGILC